MTQPPLCVRAPCVGNTESGCGEASEDAAARPREAARPGGTGRPEGPQDKPVWGPRCLRGSLCEMVEGGQGSRGVRKAQGGSQLGAYESASVLQRNRTNGKYMDK